MIQMELATSMRLGMMKMTMPFRTRITARLRFQAKHPSVASTSLNPGGKDIMTQREETCRPQVHLVRAINNAWCFFVASLPPLRSKTFTYRIKFASPYQPSLIHMQGREHRHFASIEKSGLNVPSSIPGQVVKAKCFVLSCHHQLSNFSTDRCRLDFAWFYMGRVVYLLWSAVTDGCRWRVWFIIIEKYVQQHCHEEYMCVGISVKKIATWFAMKSCTWLVGWIWSNHTVPLNWRTSSAFRPNVSGWSSNNQKPYIKAEKRKTETSSCAAQNLSFQDSNVVCIFPCRSRGTERHNIEGKWNNFRRIRTNFPAGHRCIVGTSKKRKFRAPVS